VLEASHIRPYGLGGSHAINNGILLRSDLHRLFDHGYVAVSPKQTLMVSGRLARDFANGRTYYALEGRELHLPSDSEERPDEEALEWHRDTVWQG
jgi:putative restriction endonuclease